MKTILSCIKESVNEQNKKIALHDCVTAWNGEVDCESIIHGILDRYKAMDALDVVAYGIRMERTSLTTARIVTKDGVTIMAFYKTLETYIRNPEFFHMEEINKIKTYALGEFHHLH